MKTTGECLSAETIEARFCGHSVIRLMSENMNRGQAGGKTHTAFVFIKPHANNEKADVQWDGSSGFVFSKRVEG